MRNICDWLKSWIGKKGTKKMGNLFIRITRKKISYNYKRLPNAKDDWGNNDANNMLDIFELFADEALLFYCNVQTVANIPNGRFLDTIAPGKFQLKAFIGEGQNGDPRSFYGRIHGICNCFDLENQWVDDSCVQANDKNRWLVHDTQKPKPEKPMSLTRVAWSAGCFIMHPSNLTALGEILDAYKILPGDMIDGEVVEK